MKQRKLDAWDAAGVAGLVLVDGGVRALCGWAWAAILLGAVLVGVYVVREVYGEN